MIKIIVRDVSELMNQFLDSFIIDFCLQHVSKYILKQVNRYGNCDQVLAWTVTNVCGDRRR